MAKRTYTMAELTPDVIEKLKEEHGELRKISVANSSKKYDPHTVPSEDSTELDDSVFGVIRLPNSRELSYAMSKLPSLLDAGKVVLKACWLGGDDAILNDTPMVNAAAIQCVELIEVREAKLVKL